MSLVYRSIWQDDRSDLCGTAIDTFGNWVRKKYGDDFEIHDHADQAPTGQLIVASARSVESEDGQLRCAEATLTEEQPDQRWMTRLHVMVEAGGDQWLWVDLSRYGKERLQATEHRHAQPRPKPHRRR